MTSFSFGAACGLTSGIVIMVLIHVQRVRDIYHQASAALEALIATNDEIERRLIEHIKQLESENSDLLTAIGRKP